MASKSGAWAAFLNFLGLFARLFGRRKAKRVEKFTYDMGTGPRPPRLKKGHVTMKRTHPGSGNHWWRRQLSLRGREVANDD